MRTWMACGAVVVGLLAGGCGGDGDGGGDDVASSSGDGLDPATSPDDSSSSGGSVEPGGAPGEVTVTAPPGQGVVEVDGQTIVVTWDESRFRSCEISDSSINIEFTIDDGRRLSIKGSDATGSWSAIAYASTADSGSFQYELRFPDNAQLGLGDNALSMQGGAVYMEGFAPVDDDLRPATIAVNCEGTTE